MNSFNFFLLVILLSIPSSYFILRLIFKQSIMFKFSFYVILLLLFAGTLMYIAAMYDKISIIIVVSTVNFIVGTIVFYYINNILRKPLENSIRQVETLAQGDLNIELKTSVQTDELGRLNNSLLILSNFLKSIIHEISQKS